MINPFLENGSASLPQRVASEAPCKKVNGLIKELRLRNFKAFNSFTVNFQNASLLVGPNSAGKSTVLTALRLSEACLRLAKRSKPSLACEHLGSWYQGYPLPVRDFAALNESVRHNFRDHETSLELVWKNGSKMRAVWPEITPYEEDIPAPFFYLLDHTGSTPRTIRQVRDLYSPLSVIPTLSPLEHEESILADEYVKQNQSGRLSSRHFRNQLRLLAQAREWEDFNTFAGPWMAGLELKKPVIRYDTSSIDVFFTEATNGVEKELVWAGDGVQIWLQLLLHLYRAADTPTLILDEPEVFLHADLQRRLVRLLEAMDTQIVLATHSTEVLAEADRSSIVWVDKTRRRALRSPQDESLRGLDSALGTSFNLAMAKALRARAVLFVEGKDVKLLKRIARRLSLKQLYEETTLAVIPMNGYSKWEHAEAFGWLLREFLEDSVKALVILDRDYRTDSQAKEVEGRFNAAGMEAHVWKRKELESYLLLPGVIARKSKCPLTEVESIIAKAMSNMEKRIFSQLLAERVAAEKSTGRSVATINEDGLNELELKWRDAEFRYAVCPPKDVLAYVNGQLQEQGYKAVSFSAIANSLHENEIADEMANLLRHIETLDGE